MSDTKEQIAKETASLRETATAEETTTRIFKIGTLIIAAESLRSLTDEEARKILAFKHPEVQHSEIVTSTQNGKKVVEFIPKAGRKG